MKYQIVRYMTSWAIKRKDLLFWHYIKYGDYCDCDESSYGKVKLFDSKEYAEEWYRDTFFWGKKI